MKDWKQQIVSAVVDETKGCRIVSLKDVAAANGIRHIKTQEAHEIMNAVLQAAPDYKAVRMMNTPNDSFFQSLNFVEKGLEFQTEEEWLAECAAPDSYDI
jgi:hypothetical protein